MCCFQPENRRGVTGAKERPGVPQLRTDGQRPALCSVGAGTRNRAQKPIQKDSKLMDYGLSSGADADTTF